MADPDVEREALALFELLLDVPEADRDAWIAVHSRGDHRLASRINAIREADRSAILRTGAATEAFEEEKAPTRIGVYRIVERIGRGGMGSVYRGERDADDFAHVVAIKIIKPGLLSEALVERFARERQTLARLIHPNISQLYDGGETEGGSPYIVMEYVDGLPLLDWAERQEAGPAERRRLFRDICAAVGFAHRNLIVHRDITPSNVLITADGTVKLIDFGIARPTNDGHGGGLSSRPSIGSLSLTPGYAAPERMTGTEVTTAADIYSLGKLLEKLIPPGDDRELATIVARATAADPLARYPTVDLLGDDVEAWGNDLPVSTVQGGRSYVAAKFVKRHRLGVAAAAAASLLLMGAFAVTWGAYASAERARAAEAMRFDQLRSLANYMLFDLNDRMERVVGNTQARINLADHAQTYLSALAASPGVSDALKLEAAEGFIRLARIQGVPEEPNLGEPDRAKANLDAAERLLDEIGNQQLNVAPVRARLLAYRALIQAHNDLDREDADRSVVNAITALEAVPAGERDFDWFQARSVVRKSQLSLADLASDAPRIRELAGRLEDEIAHWPAATREGRQAQIDRAYAAYYRAYSLSLTDAVAQSLPAFADAERRFRELDAARPNDPVVLFMLAWTGYSAFPAASALGDTTRSGHFIELARTTVDRLLALESADTGLKRLSGNVREGESQWLRDQRRYGEAIARQREVVAARETVLAAARNARTLSDLGLSFAILGVIARDAGDRALACGSWQNAERHFSGLASRNELLPYYLEMLTGMRANLVKCAAGRPISDFGPLR